MEEKMNLVHSYKQGRAAEYMVAAHLLLRGANVKWPSVDEGYDLEGPRGCRIQVKSTHLRTTPSVLDTYPEGVYSFGLVRRDNYSPKRRRASATIKFSDTCDIVVFWGIEQNRFWVAPAHLVDGVYGVYLGVTSDRAFEKDIPQMREMLKLGYTQKEIGKTYGIGASAVSVRLSRAGKPMHQDTASYRVRQCENAWEHILNFGAEISTPISDSTESQRKET